MARIAVDRLEGDRAVVDLDGTRIELPLSALPEGVREGSVLAFVLVSPERALDRARARQERLQSRDPGADFFDL